MSEDSKRELVSWRIAKLTDFESINKWVNQQGNIQTSLTILVRHMIDRFGYRDITDMDIQKAMFLEPYSKEFQNIIAVMDELKLKMQNNDGIDKSLEDQDFIKFKSKSDERIVPGISKAESEVRSEPKDEFYSSIDRSRL